jgi:hypothetical protein
MPVIAKNAAIVVGVYYLCTGCIHRDAPPLEPGAAIVDGTLHNPHGADSSYELQMKMKPTAVVTPAAVYLPQHRNAFDQFVPETPPAVMRGPLGTLVTILTSYPTVPVTG